MDITSYAQKFQVKQKNITKEQLAAEVVFNQLMEWEKKKLPIKNLVILAYKKGPKYLVETWDEAKKWETNRVALFLKLWSLTKIIWQ